MGIGVYVSVETKFGADSVAILWEGMAKTGSITLGMANNIFSITLFIILICIDRRYIGVGTIISPLVQSAVMDGLSRFQFPELPYLIRFWLMVLGIIILSIGSGLYVAANLGCGAYIGLTLALSQKLKRTVSFMKMFLDFLTLMGAIFLGVIPSYGPVVSLFISGPIVDIVLNKLKNLENKGLMRLRKK
ncbi:YitT family protein [Enterococcus faecium]